jgi:uncharacterized membrane protein HdeD (DUF308 family)
MMTRRAINDGVLAQALTKPLRRRGECAMAVTANQASLMLKEAVQNSIRKRSWLFMAQGVLLAAAGIVALLFPAFMTSGALVLLAWLLIISGAVQIFSLFGAIEAPSFWLQLIAIVLDIVVGFLLLTNPQAGLVAVTMLMLVLFMVAGMERIVFALMVRPLPQWGWVLGSGVVAIVCALVLFANLPQAATWLLGVLLGLHLLAIGLSEVFLAWRVRRAA